MTTAYDEQRNYRVRRRHRAIEYLGGQCVICGVVVDLEFDHRSRDDKTIEISVAIVAGWSWAKLLVELDKCQLLCQEHHKAKTSAESIWNHGTLHGYQHKKCRCEACIRAWQEAMSRYHPDRVTRKLAEHGTRARYCKKCRCSLCTEANRLYAVQLRQRS